MRWHILTQNLFCVQLASLFFERFLQSMLSRPAADARKDANSAGRAGRADEQSSLIKNRWQNARDEAKRFEQFFRGHLFNGHVH
jgi:hypothetical protein